MVGLDATAYYSENFEIICSMVNEFYGNHAYSITRLQDIFQDSNELKVLRIDLALYSCKFQFSVAVYNKVGNDHKFIVRNNKRNQRH
jgi:hypothetical protein